MNKILDKLVVNHQEHPQWCWAAVASAIALFYDQASNQIQCRVAELMFPQCDCCKNGGSDCCNQRSHLEDALAKVNHLRAGPLSGPADKQEIKTQTSNETPMCARIQWPDGGGHFVAIRGFEDSNSSRLFLDIGDPEFGECITLYENFILNYRGAGTWTHNYLTRK